jgi:hypothetical protein
VARVSTNPVYLFTRKAEKSKIVRPVKWLASVLDNWCSIPGRSFLFITTSRRLWRGETESTWYVGHYWAYCTSPGW